jgi:hypothetical protein
LPENPPLQMGAGRTETRKTAESVVLPQRSTRDLPAGVTFASLFSRFTPKVSWRFNGQSAMIAPAIGIAIRF